MGAVYRKGKRCRTETQRSHGWVGGRSAPARFACRLPPNLSTVALLLRQVPTTSSVRRRAPPASDRGCL
ncbi:hypothetical protein U9M48_020917 [Paspalum notatum var. saurae]|uniref:Uncharacterized protein n=1 Tax=Paspalum notatum var. saurae TaxID=547442 RepID=A0AAQ3WT34_PASNO